MSLNLNNNDLLNKWKNSGCFQVKRLIFLCRKKRAWLKLYRFLSSELINFFCRFKFIRCWWLSHKQGALSEIYMLRRYRVDFLERDNFDAGFVCFYEAVSWRRCFSIFDYEALAQELPEFVMNDILDYGIVDALRSYSGGYAGKINAYVEHGVYFGRNDIKTRFSDVITYGQYRDEVLRSVGKKAYLVGPYIHYAQSFYSESELKGLKKTLGRVLLVFPQHTIRETAVEYDIAVFLNYLHELKKKFDTVLVCVYWHDIVRGGAKIFIDAGFTVVTAGYFMDPNFLPRLKSIILLADMTVSNALGTHVGYCVYLDKPHQIYFQEINFLKGEAHHKDENYLSIVMREREDFVRLFSDYKEMITQAQRDLCNYYWGFDYICAPQELKRVLQELG